MFRMKKTKNQKSTLELKFINQIDSILGWLQ